MRKLYPAMAVALVLLTGCSKLTKENYDKIEANMPYKKVVDLIGKPESCSETIGISSCTWKNGKTEIDIKFVSDKVVFKTAKELQ